LWGLLLLAMGAALMAKGALTPALGVGAVAAITGYGMYIRTHQKPDLLATELVNLEALGLGADQGIDGWSLSHVLFFWVLGLLDPGRPLLYFALGAAWEGLETFLGQVPVDLGTGRVMLLGPAPGGCGRGTANGTGTGAGGGKPEGRGAGGRGAKGLGRGTRGASGEAGGSDK
jgi:hypothetical protein